MKIIEKIICNIKLSNADSVKRIRKQFASKIDGEMVDYEGIQVENISVNNATNCTVNVIE